jgi:hypothetical protein
MRLPAVTEAQRVSRDYIRDRRGAAAELVESAGRALVDLKYQARVQQEKLLSAGDTQQLETVMAQAERTLALCQEALPALQTFEDRFAMPAAFERLKAELVEEGEDPRSVQFGDNYEAMTWLADRVLLFAKYLTETQIPWLRNAIDEINQWMVERAHHEDDAPARVAEAKRRLEEMRQAHPGLGFIHSEGLLAEADRFLQQIARDRAQNYHQGVAESAEQAIAYAGGAITMAEEALAFAQDPQGAYLGARDALLNARTQLGSGDPSAAAKLRRAEELLEQARAGSATENPNWAEVLLHYNQASAAFADAIAAGAPGSA